jgi:hypothetical protein
MQVRHRLVARLLARTPAPSLLLQSTSFKTTGHNTNQSIKLNAALRVADAGCLSRIPDPDFYPSPIPDLESRISDPRSQIQKRQQKRGVKKNLLSYYFCSHKFHKIKNYCIFEMLKKTICVNFQRIIEVFTQKIFTKLSKIWVWNPGSEIRKKPILDPGVKKAPDPGSGSATLAALNFSETVQPSK